jgi:hypothetical protein
MAYGRNTTGHTGPTPSTVNVFQRQLGLYVDWIDVEDIFRWLTLNWGTDLNRFNFNLIELTVEWIATLIKCLPLNMSASRVLVSWIHQIHQIKPKNGVSTSSSAYKAKGLTLEDILAQFDAIDRVVFDPIQLEQHCDAQPSFHQPFLQPPAHLTTLPYSLHTTYSRLLQLIQIDTRQYRGYIQVKREYGSGQTC